MFTDGNKTYYFDPLSGERKSGFVIDGGKMYFFDRAGVRQYGWYDVDGKWFYSNDKGEVVTSKLETIGDAKYYFYGDGAMATSAWVEDETYYALPSGRIATNQWIEEGKYVNGAGKLTDNSKSSTKKQELENKVYTNDEYMSLVSDHVERYYDQCETLITFINDWRIEYNEDNVWNYSGDDDDYVDQHELHELEGSMLLTRAATLRAVELASQQRASGARPDGRDWKTIIDDVEYTTEKLSESVAFGQINAEDAFDDFKADGGHSSYWQTREFNYIGVGAACDVDGKMYWVVLYAK